MTDFSTDFGAAFQAGAATKIVIEKINGIDHVLVPKGCDIKSLEHLMDAPARIQAHPQFNDIDGFSGYVDEFKVSGSRIFVDDIKYNFITVFDCHSYDSEKGEANPAWCDHSASMQLDFSNEWNRFKEFDGKRLSPMDFAEFLEDNIHYLSGSDGLSPIDLLNMAQSFKINIKGAVEIDETLSAGVKKIFITDDSTATGRTADGKELSFPEKIKFDLAVFKNHSKYSVEVYLRNRKADKGLVFWIKIPDPKNIEDAAFDNVIEDVKLATNLPTLKGKFDGPNHRGR